MERLRLERARFELDVADLVIKHIDKLKSSGALQIEDRGEAAKKIRESIFGKYTKEQLEAAALATAWSLCPNRVQFKFTTTSKMNRGSILRMNQSIARTAATVLSIVSSALLLLSFQSDVLRDGNEPIAGALALIGIFGVALARRIARTSRLDSKATQQTVRAAVVTEYLAIIALFILGWVFSSRLSFFGEGPSGSTLLWQFNLASSSLSAMVLCCLAILPRTSRPIQCDRRDSGPRMALAMAVAALVMAALNFDTRAEIVDVSGKGRLIIQTSGFPFASSRRLVLEPVLANNTAAVLNVISLPNGVRIERDAHEITVNHFRKISKLPLSEEVRFRDGWIVSFKGTDYTFSASGLPLVITDFANRVATFQGMTTEWRRPAFSLLNAMVATAIIAHAGFAARRMFQSRSSSPGG